MLMVVRLNDKFFFSMVTALYTAGTLLCLFWLRGANAVITTFFEQSKLFGPWRAKITLLARLSIPVVRQRQKFIRENV